MDQFKLVTKPALLMLLMFIAYTSAANNLQQAKTQLGSYEASLKQIGSKVQTIDVRIQSYETKITDAKAGIESAKNDLDEARSALIQARHDKSEDAARKLELAQKKYDITQLGYENRQKRLQRLERKLADLQTDKQKLMVKSQSTQAQIKSQASQVLKLSSAQARANPAPQVAKAPAAPAPVKAVKPEQVAPPINLVEDINNIEPEKENSRSPIQTAKLEKARSSDAEQERLPLRSAKPSVETEGNKMQRDYAFQQMTALNTKIKADAALTEWKRYRNLELKVSRRPAEEFEYLGARQYYIETELEQGPERVKIGRKYYKANIPSDGIYVIIYDTSDKNSPTFSLFKKSWFE